MTRFKRRHLKHRQSFVDAVQFQGNNWAEVQVLAEGSIRGNEMNLVGETVEVPLADSTNMLANEGDWIAKHEAGNLYVYPDRRFTALYEAVE